MNFKPFIMPRFLIDPIWWIVNKARVTNENLKPKSFKSLKNPKYDQCKLQTLNRKCKNEKCWNHFFPFTPLILYKSSKAFIVSKSH